MVVLMPTTVTFEPDNVTDLSTSTVTILPANMSGSTANISCVSTETPEDDSVDAFLYIVVVLSFYAFAMVVLMIKYIRRENQEAELSYYFTEFIKRDKFQSPTFQNQLNVDCTRQILDSFYRPIEFHESAV